MAKYDEQFKLKIVRRYLSEQAGLRPLARQHGLDDSLLRRWVMAYQQHGRDGLRKKHTSYSAQFKLSVLQHMQQAGLSYRQTAAFFDIRSVGDIGIWHRQYHSGGIDALASRPRGRPKTMAQSKPPEPPIVDTADDERTRKELLREIAYLRAEVAYLKKLDALVQAKKAAQQKKRK
jgi:transposase